MARIAWLLGCIMLATVVIWRTAPPILSTNQRVLRTGVASLLAGAFLYYFGAIVATFFWGA